MNASATGPSVLASAEPLAFLAGGGDMGAQMRVFDWSATPLGPAELWPQSLKTIVNLMLNSRYPMFVWWGDELINLYNDGYTPVLGRKHAGALGRPARELWSDIWKDLDEQVVAVMQDGRASWNQEVLLFMERNGFTEETYFTWSYSPIMDEHGVISGLFCACNDDTPSVLARRRMRTLRDLAGRSLVESRSVEQACHAAATTLAENPYDFPFALLYLLDDNRREAHLVQAVNIAGGTAASPARVELGSGEDVWGLGDAFTVRRSELMDVPQPLNPLPAGAWTEDRALRVLVIPLDRPGQDHPTGFLVAGVSPRLPYNDEYRGFLELAARHLATTIANARAYQAEQRRLEALAELDRAKTAFFSNVSHEFRTPLTLMLGPLEELLQEGAGVSDTVRAELRVIYRNSMRLLRLVNTLLDFSRIEAGRVEAWFEETDLPVFTAELASLFRSAVEKAGLRLVVDCPPLPGITTVVDRELWEKIVLNLLSNALKYTLDGSITVSLTTAGDRVVLRVSDTGVGIPEDELPRMFDRFHRVRESRGRTHEGTGIGLALVRELAVLHGGEVAVTSTVGRGSVFTVTLPTGSAHLDPGRVGTLPHLASAGTTSAAYIEEAVRWLPLPAPREVTTGRARILCVDDNADMLNYVRRLLIQANYDVEGVGDGVAALEAARRDPPALILTDVMLPRMDGFGLLHQIRSDERLRTIPVIMLSARAGEVAKVEGMEAGADDYLIKPFSARELLARVESHVKLQEVRRQAGEELRQRDEQLRQSAKMEAIGRLAGGLAHDFNNQLYAISGFADFVAEDRGLAPQSRHDLKEIQKAAERMASLTRQLLAFSRQQVLKLETLDLNEAVRDSQSLLQRLLGADISINLHLAPTPLWVRVDRGQLLQVLMNLAINARDAMPEGGVLALDSSPLTHGGKPCAALRVTDSGDGIDAAHLPHIFDPFFTTKDVGRGTGLGLATVHGIVTQSEGQIWAENELAGGARFTVILPLTGQPPAESHPAAATESVRRGRILLVEDEATVRAVILRTLEAAGYTVVPAENGADALERLAEAADGVDAILSDIVMPVMGGAELVRQVKSRWPDMPVIWMSGYPKDGPQTSGVLHDDQPFLQKPVPPDLLLRTVNDVIGRPAVKAG